MLIKSKINSVILLLYHPDLINCTLWIVQVWAKRRLGLKIPIIFNLYFQPFSVAVISSHCLVLFTLSDWLIAVTVQSNGYCQKYISWHLIISRFIEMHLMHFSLNLLFLALFPFPVFYPEIYKHRKYDNKYPVGQ